MTTTTTRSHVDPSDAVLVEHAAGGDRGAFTTLYRRHIDTVHDHVARWCGDPALAADATQEAFMALLDRLDTIRDGQAVLAWLFRTARNRATDQLRRVAREHASDDVDGSLLRAVDADRAGSPERAAEAGEAADWLWDVARGLDERTFSVLDLTVRHGLSPAELAGVLGTTRGNADVLVHRMRRRVRSLFGATAFLRAGGGCTTLASLCEGLGDPLDLPGARAVERHADGCEECAGRRRRAIAPLRAYAALAHVAAPPSVHAAVEEAAAAHFGVDGPGGASTSSTGARAGRWVGRALVVLGIAATAAAVTASPVDEPVPVATSVLVGPASTTSATPTPSPAGRAPASPTTSVTREESPPAPSPAEPTVAVPGVGEPDDDPAEPAGGGTRESTPALVVEIVRPTTGDRITVDGAGRTTTQGFGVAAVVAGADDAQVAWATAAGDPLLVGETGTLTLQLPAPCAEQRHDLVAMATTADGRVAHDEATVTLVAGCPALEVVVRSPSAGTVLAATGVPDGPVGATAKASAVGIGDDGSWTWRWTSDQSSGSLLDAPDGALPLTTPDCATTTTHRLTVTAVDPANGRTGTATTSVVLRPTCR